jgi:hypothetical protein
MHYRLAPTRPNRQHLYLYIYIQYLSKNSLTPASAGKTHIFKITRNNKLGLLQTTRLISPIQPYSEPGSNTGTLIAGQKSDALRHRLRVFGAIVQRLATLKALEHLSLTQNPAAIDVPPP